MDKKSLFSSLCVVVFISTTAAAQTLPDGYPADYQKTVAGAEKEGRLVIYSTTDTKAAGPLLKGFAARYPQIKVEYNDMNSTELYNRYISEQAAGGTSGDVIWSSSMDTALKLASDYAMPYASAEIGNIPTWAVWQQKAYGTTYEPLVFVYNKRLIKQDEVPSNHEALAQLISSQPDRFKNKVTTYDIEKSALGFMLSVYDRKADPQYFANLGRMAKGGLSVQSSTGTMLERVSSGENLIGFNILGSYAETRAKDDPSLGIAYPNDYTLVLSRVMFISNQAENGNAAKVWLDYVLSKEGQAILANQSDIPSLRNDIDGENDVDGLTKRLGKALRPIAVDDGLLTYLAQDKRLDHIKQWRAAAK
ncbi:ABC transporter substrate-binding protein [Sodalis praecaptivus]|nr:ABC transporter substrate-binding protein [Sodalis praecaptivus]